MTTAKNILWGVIMKKAIKALAAVMVVLTLCLSLLAGCAGTSIVGKWEATSAKMGDIEFDLADMEAFGATETMGMEFNEDGTVDGYTNGEYSGTMPYTDNGNGSYTVNGQTLKIEGDKLLMPDNAMNMTLIFTKSDFPIIISAADFAVDPVGTWKLTAAEAMGAQIDPATMGSDNTTMVLNENGTCTGISGVTNGTWSLNGNEIAFSDSIGTTLTGTFDGTYIIIDMEIAKLIYTRAYLN